VPGPPAGVEEGMPFESASSRLAPGDLLVLATDGIAEARALSGGSNFFGSEGPVAAARSASAGSATAEDVGAEVLARAKALTGGRLRDDVCLLVARRY
jgi:serine phosphatase RsbU (regulator of sigma subunit)